MIIISMWAATMMVASAQSFHVSPKAGINYAYFNDNFDEEEIKGKTGFQVGVDFRFGEKLYIAPGVHYVQQSNNINNPDINFKTNAIRVPILIGGDVLKADRWGIRAYGGPSGLIALTEDDALIQIEDWIRKDFIFGLDAGVGLDLGIFTIDLQHSWGLNNFIDWNGVDVKGRTFYLSAGLLF